jgi:tetrapyrrole methylase family protein/MazG family protein
VSRALPPLERAWKLQKKAAKAGFDWPDAQGAAGKAREELDEALEAVQEAARAEGGREKIEEELGDLLFSVANLCRHFGVEPSLALGRANGKFARRFAAMEKMMREAGLELKSENLGAMDGFWDAAKARESC